MVTLKTIRTKNRLNQNEVASKLNISIPALSLYESGATPVLEDMVNAESLFGQILDWSANETIDPISRKTIIRAFIALSRRYPLVSVLNFIQRALKQDSKSGDPSRTISHYTSMSYKVVPVNSYQEETSNK